MKLALTVAAALSIGVPALSTESTVQSRAAASDDSLKPMVKLKLQDLDGKTIDPDSLKGGILVLDFWATWCAPCIAEIPEFNALQRKYADRGVKVVGVTMASGSLSEIKPFVSRFKMKYPILLGDDNQTYDLNIFGYPTTYLVTRDWKVYQVYVGAGASKAKRLEADIQKLINFDAEPAPATK